MLEWSASPELAFGDPVSHRQASPHWSKGRESKITRGGGGRRWRCRRAMRCVAGSVASTGIGGRGRIVGGRGSGCCRGGRGRVCVGSVMPAGGGWCASRTIAGSARRWRSRSPMAMGGSRWSGVGCRYVGGGAGVGPQVRRAYRGSRLVVGASMHGSVAGCRPVPGWAGGRETRRALSLLRSLVAEGKVRARGHVRSGRAGRRGEGAAGGGRVDVVPVRVAICCGRRCGRCGSLRSRRRHRAVACVLTCQSIATIADYCG